jgi:carbamoyl-phosphate synthase large subunit
MVHYFREALAGGGLVHAGNSINSLALQAADKAVLTPPIYEPHYIDFLIDYCKKHGITALLSLFDIDLPVLAESKQRFAEEGIQAVVSDLSAVRVCNDKWLTSQWLRKNGIEGPKTFPGLNDAIEALDHGRLTLPVMIKPRWGTGSIAVYEAETREEIDVLYRKAVRQVFASYLSFESQSDRENCVVIQEKLEGQEYGCDVVNDLRKNYVTTFVKKKLSMRSGETDRAVTEDVTELRELGKAISGKLKHSANLDVDCFRCNGQFHVLEMNCRFGGHYPFSHLAGANLPRAIIKWLQNEEPEEALLKIEYGVEGAKDILPFIVKRIDL